MKAKARESSPANEVHFELKYCERCGGLWLRPVGGGQIYCVGCGRAMGELPPASHKAGARGCREVHDGLGMRTISRAIRTTTGWIWTRPEVWHERLCGLDWGGGG